MAYTPPKWAFSPSGEHVVAYHGTSKDRAKKIRTEGIKVNAKNRLYPSFVYDHPERKNAVYLAGDRDEAHEWAKTGHGAKNAETLEVHIPKNDKRFDWDESDPYEARYQGKIPAKWVK